MTHRLTPNPHVRSYLACHALSGDHDGAWDTPAGPVGPFVVLALTAFQNQSRPLKFDVMIVLDMNIGRL